MRTFLRTTFAALVVVFVFSSSQCHKTKPPASIRQYSYTKPILNPPDTFQVIFSINTLGDKFAHVTFKEDAVWLIENLGDGRSNFRIENGTDTHTIVKSDTLGLKGGFEYTLVANNNNYTDLNNLFTQFTKLNRDYTTFEPKF